jgi:exodeoxyribonuclease VII small subunit
MDFEKKLSRLEEIVQKMEKGDLALEESLKFFEEGVKLSRECHGQLAKAESQIKKLVGFDANGKALTEDFKGENSDS